MMGRTAVFRRRPAGTLVGCVVADDVLVEPRMQYQAVQAGQVSPGRPAWLSTLPADSRTGAGSHPALTHMPQRQSTHALPSPSIVLAGASWRGRPPTEEAHPGVSSQAVGSL